MLRFLYMSVPEVTPNVDAIDVLTKPSLSFKALPADPVPIANTILGACWNKVLKEYKPNSPSPNASSYAADDL